METAVDSTKYTSPSGAKLVRYILAKLPNPLELHSYQEEGICQVLDGEDVLATMATGAGKTGLLSLLMIVIHELLKNPTLTIRELLFPQSPCMIVVCLTKALEHDMSIRMTDFGLQTIVINRDTLADAWSQKRDLWNEARQAPDALLLSPEELATDECRQLFNDKTFAARTTVLAVDEIHLLYYWGQSF
ncbi:hypothetical protein AN958_01008 [Leucoagaricus sp. SymC.cos]|nr:hypothetical protein AN958_01008 [Leucoagaricus sp. SymC.cos]